MSLFTKVKKEAEPKIIKFQKVKPTFITTDGLEHTGYEYRWAKRSSLSCSVGEYIMYDINNDGYIQDKDDIMYPLANVLSIKWDIIDRKIVIDKTTGHDAYRIYFNDDEVEKMQIYLDKKESLNGF